MYTVFDRNVWEPHNTTLLWRSRCKSTHKKTPAWSVRVWYSLHTFCLNGVLLNSQEQNKWSEGLDSYLSNLQFGGAERRLPYFHIQKPPPVCIGQTHFYPVAWAVCEWGSYELLKCTADKSSSKLSKNSPPPPPPPYFPVVASYSSMKPPHKSQLQQPIPGLNSLPVLDPSMKFPPSGRKLSQHETPSQW